MHNKKNGFTLIELLIVIAIIGIIAGIILGSFKTAKNKAENAQRLSEVVEYQKALELSFDKDGVYPQVGTYTCMGNYSGSVCWNGAFSTNLTFNTALARYIPPLPIPANISPYNGYLYFNCPSNAQCSSYPGGTTAHGYMILWFMDGANASCGPGQVIDPNYGGTNQTYCALPN